MTETDAFVRNNVRFSTIVQDCQNTTEIRQLNNKKGKAWYQQGKKQNV